MSKVIITTFTDPMMGLSYECEPIFRKLETHYGKQLEFRYVMGGLVRNVYDFVNKNDLQIGTEYALKRYLKKLTGIYKSEETISGMPIHMEGFCLFDTSHTSSTPLCLAYKAAQLTDKSKADLFLYNLRYATVYETRPTTHFDEILRVVQKTGIDPARFTGHYHGAAKVHLQKDFAFFESLGVYSLPAYLIQYEDKSLLVNRLIGYDTFTHIIDKISEGNIQARKPTVKIEDFIKMHPLISHIELKLAFELTDVYKALKDVRNIKFDKEFIHYENHI